VTRILRAFVPVAFLLAATPPDGPSRDELLWHHRNLGKVFYENPATQYQAVEELKAALDLAPDSARERCNYGLALLKAGKTAAGIAELEAVQISRYNLGTLYKLAGKPRPCPAPVSCPLLSPRERREKGEERI
jgi:predicted Zn-dependent protease